jgi:hypothetical protein
MANSQLPQSNGFETRRFFHEDPRVMYISVVLSGLVFSVLAIGLEVRGFKPDGGRWIFKGDKIRITPSFGGEVKPHVVRSYGMLKNPSKYDGNTS